MDTPTNTGKQEGRQWETRGNFRKTDTPSNTGTHVGRHWKTMGQGGNGRQCETMRHKASIRTPSRRHHPKHVGRQWRQDLGKAGTPSHTGTHVGRQRKGRQDLGKADAPFNSGKHIGY